MKLGNYEIVKTKVCFNNHDSYIGYVTLEIDECIAVQFLDNEHGLRVENVSGIFERIYLVDDKIADPEIDEFFNSRPLARLALIGVLYDG